MCYQAQACTTHCMQANIQRDDAMGQRIATLFRKPAEIDDGLVSQRTILPELEFKLLLCQKERGSSWLMRTSWCWPAPRGNVIILCSCNFPVRPGHCVPANSHQGKCYFLFSSFLSICEWKVLWLKGQAWEAETWEEAIMYILSYREHSFTVWLDEAADPAWLSPGKGALRLALVNFVLLH